MFARKWPRLARNVWTDIRYGGFLGGVSETPFRALGAHATVNSDYQVLHRIFEHRIRRDDLLVDVGCGRGRVINYWLSQFPGNRIVGLELNPAVASEVARRCARFSNVTILQGDAVENLPADGTVFYLYSPFSEDSVARFAARCARLRRGKSGARVFYGNPEFGDVLVRHPAWSFDERLEIPQPWAKRPFICSTFSLRSAWCAPPPTAEPMPNSTGQA